MAYQTRSQIKAQLLEMIPAATAHNRTVRPAPRMQTTVSAFELGEAALLGALYVEIDERFPRSEVEAALMELSREGQVNLYPESAQADLTDYERMVALRMGNQERHWVQLAG